MRWRRSLSSESLEEDRPRVAKRPGVGVRTGVPSCYSMPSYTRPTPRSRACGGLRTGVRVVPAEETTANVRPL